MRGHSRCLRLTDIGPLKIGGKGKQSFPFLGYSLFAAGINSLLVFGAGFRNLAPPKGCINLVNNGIHYQPQLVTLWQTNIAGWKIHHLSRCIPRLENGGGVFFQVSLLEGFSRRKFLKASLSVSPSSTTSCPFAIGAHHAQHHADLRCCGFADLFFGKQKNSTRAVFISPWLFRLYMGMKYYPVIWGGFFRGLTSFSTDLLGR